MTLTRSNRNICLLVFAALLVGGCASPTKPDAMIADAVMPVHTSSSDVSVAVSGGKETSSVGKSQISNDAFAQALRASIEKAGLFSKVADSGTRYRLTSFIGKVDQPNMGFAMTVKLEVSYTLKDLQAGTTVWTKDIESEHTAQVSDAFAGIARLRPATEGAAKDNIAKAIAEISALNL